MNSTAIGLVITEDIKCPKCSSETFIRTSKKGPNVGHSFCVCIRYPECKGKVALETVGENNGFYIINHVFLIGQMIVPGSSYWNLGMGRQKGEVEKDEEGIQTMKDLGRNMAWLLKKLKE